MNCQLADTHDAEFFRYQAFYLHRRKEHVCFGDRELESFDKLVAREWRADLLDDADLLGREIFAKRGQVFGGVVLLYAKRDEDIVGTCYGGSAEAQELVRAPALLAEYRAGYHHEFPIVFHGQASGDQGARELFCLNYQCGTTKARHHTVSFRKGPIGSFCGRLFLRKKCPAFFDYFSREVYMCTRVDRFPIQPRARNSDGRQAYRKCRPVRCRIGPVG